MTQKPLIEVKHIKKYFQQKKNLVKAIDDISLTIYEGETLGLVGESGCGKSTLGRILLKLESATEGQIFYKQQDLCLLKEKQMKEIRKEIQMIFQDPYACLNPRMTIADIIAEPIEVHRLAFGNTKNRRIDELLHLVGLDVSYKNRFPHELSGGQRQRIGIARALALDPKFLVCDEPISALDVSVQAQIINLLKKLQKEARLTYLFIAHDLGIVKYISSRVAVMYLGKLVELASSEDLYSKPKHPYTQALLSAVPIPDPKMEKSRQKLLIKGELSSSLQPTTGCIFSSRCPKAEGICFCQSPPLLEIKQGHQVACHFSLRD